MKLLVSGGTADVRNSDAAYIGQLIVPRSGNTIMGNRAWACDNDAFNGFDADRFRKMLDRLDPHGCSWVATPDIVADWRATRRQFDEWEPELRQRGYPVALVLQDGLASTCQIPWMRIDAVFIGGTTEFKLGTVARRAVWEAKDRGRLAHMGRVNSFRRLRYAIEIGCDTIDGTCFSRFPGTHIPRFIRFMKRMEDQLWLW